MNTLKTQSGLTLVELLVSIVIIAVAASAVLAVLATASGSSADPMVRRQATSIAEAYLEEILLKPFADPDGVDGESTRAAFDDVDDYHGLVDSGARDQFGSAIPNLDAYTVSVNVGSSSALTGVPAADALRIDVNVTWESSVDFTISAYRTRL